MTDEGAHFYRCDFQVHTPRDRNWTGKRPTSEAERSAWADELVATCRSKSLDAIAITDHHDFVMFPYVRAAASREKDEFGNVLPEELRLVVFPGLELTLGVPCQALLLLDADFSEDKLDAVLTCLAVTPTAREEEQQTQPERLGIGSLRELYEKLDEHSWLRGRYIAFPNVTDNGLGTLLRSGFSAKYAEMPCVGGYVDGALDNLGEGARKIIAGKDRQYGHKRIAVIQTSDSRHADCRNLGSYSTWIKWSVPTAEALRQACLAQESRISQQIPQMPTVFLSRVSVDNSMFLGPIELELNPQFNAIIGGRGTGKSTLLDYLRWALCDVPATVTDDEELGNPSARRARLIENTLGPTASTVEVHFTINKIPHVVRRNAGSGDISLKVGSAEFAKVREADVRELLPIQAYSQKQLSSVAVRLDELTRFVTSPIRRNLATIDERFNDAASKLRENYVALQRQRQVLASIRRLELQIASLADQAAQLRNSLEDVSDTDREILQEKPKYDALESHAAGWKETISEADQITQALLDRLTSLSGQISNSVEGPEPAKVTLTELDSEAARLMNELTSAFASAVKDFRDGHSKGSRYAELVGQVEQLVTTFNETYLAVKERSTEHAVKLRELADVEKQHQDATQSLRGQRLELQTLGQPDVQHGKLLHGIFVLMVERSDHMESQCAALSELSGGLLRATLERGQGFSTVADRFRAAVQGSNLQRAKIDELFLNLAQDTNPLATWEECLEELEKLTGAEDESDITSQVFPVLSRLGLRVADLKKIASKLNSDGWILVATTPVYDKPRFEYQSKENQFIDFASASPGQQATALLRALLAQQGPPLFVDQPEDDLDSEVVQQIVESIWMAKQHRQLLFTSHNANLVVNGDAELVIHCDYRVRGEQSRGEIKNQGAIDLPVIRTAITTVMEGGEKAFRLRKEKYGF